jgi:UDP-N-acetylmuramate dehydrogenase
VNGLAELVTSAELKLGEPLAVWTSVRVGGPAEALVRPRSLASLESVLKFAHREGVPLTLLGGGANTLIGDGGIPGITLKINGDYFPEEIDGTKVILNAGSAIARAVTVMKQQRLVGAEFLAGIPGTLGGAVAMNAGTKHGECMRLVEALELATPDGIGWVNNVPYRYRHTDLPPGSVVTRVCLRLVEGDVEASAKAMEVDLAYRKRTQPLSQPNFGSVFQNPPGKLAGVLLEQAGLKGTRIGNAEISTLHANWVVNLGNAKAADMTALMAEAQRRVQDMTGISLHAEVRRVGKFF